MEPDPNTALARYPLRSIALALRRFRAPTGPFDPAGAWEQTWRVCTAAAAAADAAEVGRLTLRRRVSGKTARLEVRYDKALTGGRQEIRATLEGPADHPLATPRRWAFHIRYFSGGRSIPCTETDAEAAWADGRIVLTDAHGRRTIDPGGPYTVNWSLFDAVQRLPGPATRPLAFTLIDHFDQVKPETTLAFRGAMDVRVAGGKTVRTFAYEQFGRGNVPWVYWTDEAGRLLWIVAGLEVYLLATDGPGSGPPPARP